MGYTSVVNDTELFMHMLDINLMGEASIKAILAHIINKYYASKK